MKIYPEKIWIDVDSKDKPFILHNEATMGMCAYIRSDLAHAASLREPLGNEGWRPIETYDYINFPLVLLAGFITPSDYAQSNGSRPFWEISIGRCWHVNTRKFTGFLGQQPTHWQPLPSPPSTKPEEKE